MANRTLRVLSRMFNVALDREWVEANPASLIPEPGEEQSRDRVLSDEELRELWAVLEINAYALKIKIHEPRTNSPAASIAWRITCTVGLRHGPA